MSVTPTTLTNVSNYGWGDLYYAQSDSNYHYYKHSWDSSGTGNHGVRVKFTTGTGYNLWSDGNPNHDPSTFDNNADGYVYCYNSVNTLLQKFLAPTSASWISSGPTVTQTRTTHTGIIPNSSNFTIRAPTGLSYDKIGVKKFRLKFYDQNEIATYNLTVTWQTASGTNNTTLQITSGSGDLQVDVEPTDIVSGSITLSINYAVFAMTNFGLQEIAANNVFDTFQYYETGPYTASFSPNFGLPGQTIAVSIADTNPYPDNDTPTTFEQTPGGSLIGMPMNSANNYSNSVTNAFTSQHGTYKIYNGSDVLATANYDTNYVAPTTTSNGGGKPDRYPLIMTNLFNRNRSLYSIGMTHKDTWDLFL